MPTLSEIPTNPYPQTLSVAFPNGQTYNLRLIFMFGQDDCWLLDIADADDKPLVCGIPLVTGCDLIGQYAYLGFGCSLYCWTDGERTRPPQYWSLGTTSHLWVATFP